MPSTYNEYAEQTRSSKLLLCHAHAKQRLSVFTLDSGTIYKKSVNHFVTNVTEDGSNLTQANSSSLSSGEWYFDALTNTLYINATDDLNPNKHKIVVTYRLFFSNMPIDLPYDLDNGTEVHYDGRLVSSSPIKKELDYEQIGIVLETNSNISFENTDGYFDALYDTLIFENNALELFSWSETLPLDQHKRLFSGIILDKSFNEKSVKFSCKDTLYKLREPIQTANFSESDGNVPERFLNKPKRRVYGQHQQLQCVPIDSILDGYEFTGTVTGSSGTSVLTGTGTSFLDECSPEDELFYNDGNQTFRLGVKSVDSDTQITLSEELDINVSGTIKNKPDRPWRKKNRNWHIAGHKLRSPSTTITSALNARRFFVADATDILDGDLIAIDGTNVFAKTVRENKIVLTASFNQGLPEVGATVTKNPVRKAFLNGSEVFIDRDWTVTNNTSDAILNLDELSEFNIAQVKNIALTVDFTNASREITINGADFSEQLKPRDWIRSDDLAHAIWYEVLSVTYDVNTNDTNVEIRTPYAGSTTSTNAQKKNINVIDDESIVTINCIGKENSSGQWVKTASDVVKDLLVEDALLTNINTSSFVSADIDAPYTVSYKIPDSIGGSIKEIRNIISDVNKSIFGALTVDNNQDFKYEVLTPEKPENMPVLKDDDILGISNIRSKNEIVRKVNAKFRSFADKFNGDDSTLLYEFTSTFVDDLIGSKRELDLELFLYDLKDATVIAQRYAFYNSLSQSTVKVKGKLNLALLEINDKVIIKLDRLYKRFGNKDSRKIGIINSVVQDYANTTIEINDLGNIYNRVANISDNDASDFSSADNEEKIKYSYIVSNETLTPDINSDDELYMNLIG